MRNYINIFCNRYAFANTSTFIRNEIDCRSCNIKYMRKFIINIPFKYVNSKHIYCFPHGTITKIEGIYLGKSVFRKISFDILEKSSYLIKLYVLLEEIEEIYELFKHKKNIYTIK